MQFQYRKLTLKMEISTRLAMSGQIEYLQLIARSLYIELDILNQIN